MKTIDSTRVEVEALQAALAAWQARAAAAEAKVSDAQAQIAAPTLMIEKLRRALYGRRSERSERLLGQLELELDELTASATEDDLAAETAPGSTTQVKGFERRRPSRKPFPEHLPRERVVVPAPASCTCCGSQRLSKVGEDVAETLEVVPRQWKVIQTVREKFTCRDCEKLSQPPAPYHVVPRGWAGPNLLATIVFEKYGQHQPLNRQSERYAREGVELSISRLADQVGACAVALRPLHELIAAHVLAAQRLHGDDTPVPVLAKGKTDTARAWAYVRDDAPFAGQDPPAALYSPKGYRGLSAARRTRSLGKRHGLVCSGDRPGEVCRIMRANQAEFRIATMARVLGVSSSPRSSTTSTRRLGSPMFSPASPSCRTPGGTNSCPGTGEPSATRPWLRRPAHTSRRVFEPAGPAGADLTSRSTHRMGTTLLPTGRARARMISSRYTYSSLGQG